MKVKLNDNYQSALKRIKNAKTENALQKVEAGITRVYNAGFFTENEFMRLDGKILDKKIGVDNGKLQNI